MTRAEISWERFRWNEMRWSVECEERTVRCEVWSVKSAVWSVEFQVWHLEQWSTFAQSTRARVSLAHGARKFYKCKRFYSRSLRQLSLRLVRVLLVSYQILSTSIVIYGQYSYCLADGIWHCMALQFPAKLLWTPWRSFFQDWGFYDLGHRRLQQIAAFCKVSNLLGGRFKVSEVWQASKMSQEGIPKFLEMRTQRLWTIVSACFSYLSFLCFSTFSFSGRDGRRIDFRTIQRFPGLGEGLWVTL